MRLRRCARDVASFVNIIVDNQLLLGTEKMFEQPVMSTCRVGLVCVIAAALSLYALYSTDTGACCGHHWNGLENVQASPPGIRRSFNL
jgi:hypothetical protein